MGLSGRPTGQIRLESVNLMRIVLRLGTKITGTRCDTREHIYRVVLLVIGGSAEISLLATSAVAYR